MSCLLRGSRSDTMKLALGGVAIAILFGVHATMVARICFAVLFVACWCPLASAQATSAAAISELITVGWDTKPEGRARAEETYLRAVEDHPGDRQLVYAYALVKMQQRQFPEASRLLDQYLAIEKQDALAWRAKSWLSMLMKSAPTSLVELDKLSQVLADEKVKLPIATRQELIQFLGRMIGFLEGPGEGSVNAATLVAAKAKIAGRLTETEREAFDQGVSAVVDEFGVLATAKDDAQVQEIATAEKQKREQLAQLDKDAVDIGARKEELKITAERIESEVASENATYAKADAPLADEFNRIARQASDVDRDLSNVSSDIVSLRGQAAREKDPNIRNRIFRDIDRLEGIAARLDNNLRSLERTAAGVRARRATLLAQHNQVLAGYASSLGAAQREFKGLESREKRADNLRNKLRKPTVGNTGKVIALNNQAVALSTYEVFPLEAEKQRLLDQSEVK